MNPHIEQLVRWNRVLFDGQNASLAAAVHALEQPAAQAAPVVAASELTDERAAFELWATVHNLDAERHPSHEYEDGQTRAARAAWQARAVSAAAPAASVAVPMETLRLIEAAMNHMGDALNNVDAVEDEDEEATAEAFRAIHALTSGAAPATPAAQAQQPAVDGWIACADRLPECDMKPGSLGVEVLIYPQFERGEHTAFYGCRCTDYPSFYKHGVTLGRVTHWMPLPPAPGLMEAE